MRHLLTPFGLKPKPRKENPYADMYPRALAACIDFFWIYTLIAGLSLWKTDKIYAAFGMSSLAAQPVPQTMIQMSELLWQVRYPWMLDNLVTVLMIGVFYVGSQVVFDTTPGKWLIGVKVVRHGDHAKLSAWRYMLRYLAYIPASLPLMLGIFWMSFTKERRGWHDYIADTVVLNLRPRGWYWNQVKRGYYRLRGKTPSAPVEQSVGEPAAEQRHDDGNKPVD